MRTLVSSSATAPVELARALAGLDLAAVNAVKDRRYQIEQRVMVSMRAERDRIQRSIDRLQLTVEEGNRQLQVLNDEFAVLYDEYDALEEFPAIGALRQRDEEAVVDEVVILLSWFQGQVNLTQAMTDVQIESAAWDIVQSQGDLLPEELVDILRKAVRGHFGELYNRFDLAVLHTWIKRWRKERIETAALRSLNAHQAGVAPQRIAEPDELKDRLCGIAGVGQLLGDAGRAFRQNNK